MKLAGIETEWFHFGCLKIDPKAKLEGSRSCESCRLGKDPRIGKKVGGSVQMAVEVIGVGGVVGSGGARRDGPPEGLSNGVSFQVCRGGSESNSQLSLRAAR